MHASCSAVTVRLRFVCPIILSSSSSPLALVPRFPAEGCVYPAHIRGQPLVRGDGVMERVLLFTPPPPFLFFLLFMLLRP